MLRKCSRTQTSIDFTVLFAFRFKQTGFEITSGDKDGYNSPENPSDKERERERERLKEGKREQKSKG